MKKIVFSLSLFLLILSLPLSSFAVSVGRIQLKNSSGSLFLQNSNLGSHVVYRTNIANGYVVSYSRLCGQGDISSAERKVIKQACNDMESGNKNVKQVKNAPDLFYIDNPGFDLSSLDSAKPAGVAVMVHESVDGKSMMVIEEDK